MWLVGSPSPRGREHVFAADLNFVVGRVMMSLLLWLGTSVRGDAPVHEAPGAAVRGEPGASVHGEPGASVREIPDASVRGAPDASVLGAPDASVRGTPDATAVRGAPGASVHGEPDSPARVAHASVRGTFGVSVSVQETPDSSVSEVEGR